MKKVLITGASSGVGRSIANHLYLAGYQLILISRRLDYVDEDFKDQSRISAYSVDLSDPNKAEPLVDEIVEQHGFIPFVINNAGILVTGLLDEVSWAVMQNAINVNARMPLYIMQRALPKMKENNFGRIINITSGAPLNCFPNVGVYSASKAMLNTMTVTLSKEYKDFNIKINLMSPGPVRSEMSPNAELLPDICHPTVDFLMNSSKDSGETGKFYWLGYEVPLFPDLEGVQWLQGIGNEKLRKIL